MAGPGFTITLGRENGAFVAELLPDVHVVPTAVPDVAVGHVIVPDADVGAVYRQLVGCAVEGPRTVAQ
jgi:hypothetical protein